MGHKFADIAFTDSVRGMQEIQGSRKGYASWDEGPDVNQKLNEREIDFISKRDSFYLASVSETGWPYVQHRGGPVGFVRVLDDQTIGYSDFTGNRQYVSLGNISKNDRVSLFFMDYLNRQRLKLFGRIQLVEEGESDVLEKLTMPDFTSRIERRFIIKVVAFDWNCPKYITPRYTEAEVTQMLKALKEDIK